MTTTGDLVPELGHPPAVARLADVADLGVEDVHGPRQNASATVDEHERQAVGEVPGHPPWPNMLQAVGSPTAGHAHRRHARQATGPTPVQRYPEALAAVSVQALVTSAIPPTGQRTRASAGRKNHTGFRKRPFTTVEAHRLVRQRQTLRRRIAPFDHF